MGKMYGDWETLGDRLAEGGQGEIYEVKNVTGTPSGVWLLKRLKNPKRQSRFERELAALELLHGAANVIQIKDWGALKSATANYYVMERGDGSLGDLAPAGGYPVAAAVKIFSHILDGVEAIHQAKAVHRDLKPENIIMFGQTAKVADMGLALLVDEPRITPSDEAVGPRFYMAPELEHGRNLDVDARADLYSLGKILYWLLSGGVNLPRERYSEPTYRLEQTKAPSLAAFSRVFAATLTQEARARCKNVQALRELLCTAVEAYRTHPDAVLEALLLYGASSVVDKLAAEDVSVAKAFFQRIKLGLATVSANDLLTLAEAHPGLIDNNLLGILDDTDSLSAEQLRRAARLYFRDEQTVHALSFGFGFRSATRMALAKTAIKAGDREIREHMAKFWQWTHGDAELAHLLVAAFPANTKLPKELVTSLSITGISADMTAVILRGIREHPSDSELIQLASFALAKSSGSDAESAVVELFEAVKDHPEILQQAVLTSVVSKAGAAAWSRFSTMHQCPEKLVKLASIVIKLLEQRESTVDTDDGEDSADL